MVVFVRSVERWCGGLFSPPRSAREFESVRALQQSVHDGVGDGGVTEPFVPVADGQLRRGDEGASPAILDHLQEVGRLIVAERTQ